MSVLQKQDGFLYLEVGKHTHTLAYMGAELVVRTFSEVEIVATF